MIVPEVKDCDIGCRIVIVLNMDIVGMQEKYGDPKQFVGEANNDQAQPSNGYVQNGSAATRFAFLDSCIKTAIYSP